MNPLAAAVEIIKAQSAVSAIVGSRVYGVSIPGGKSKFPCVMIRQTTGGGSPFVSDGADEYEASYDIRCYGDTQIIAQSVASAINASILGAESITTTNYRLAEATEQMAPIDIVEPVTDAEDWNCVFMTHRWVVEEI